MLWRTRWLVAVMWLGCGGGGTIAPDASDLPDASEDGAVSDGAAPAPRCGDGIVQRNRGEVCDDGNNEDGDGCSADCTSDESCGNGVTDTAAGEVCDDGNTDDGDECRGDCRSDYRCGNGVVDTTAEGGRIDEVCDDGNTAGGDGCSADCLSDEACGNGIVDLAAGEVCDDGNTDDGDDCSADCRMSTLCGNGRLDGAEECDDGNTDDGDGCSSMCFVERCGNGRLDPGETCDDGNTDDGDGCENDCTWTCAGDEDCADGNLCNGPETCTSPGTIESRCVAGTPPGDGTSCGTDRICNGGVCAAVGCGDGIVSGAEQCDDGNTTNGDGCESDCTWTCAGNADCSDGNLCNGTETCTSPGTLASRCAAGTPPATGSVCDRDGNPATRDVCRMNMCVASVCGDGYLDMAGGEQCDDGNTMPGDGCSPTCQIEVAVPPTGFRMTALQLISPRIVIDVGEVVRGGSCQDITQNCARYFVCVADSVNAQIASAINPPPGGDYSLHIVNVFDPLVPASTATTPLDIHFNAECDAMPTPDACSADPMMPDVVSGAANNRTSGACFTPVASDVNGRRGTTTVTYSPTANTTSAPCFATDEQNITVNLSGILVPLTRARVAGTYSGTPANRLASGVVTGFLSVRAAADVLLPDTLPAPLGGSSLYRVLQAAGATTTNSAGATVASACNVGGGTHEDDRDTLTDGTRGFWFFLNFTAEQISWSE